MNIIICDDRIDDRKNVSDLLSDYGEKKNYEFTITEYDSGEQLCEDQSALEACQLLFLDINMQGMDGLKTAMRIKEKYPKLPVVQVTAYMNYALDGYKVKASRFLLKDNLADRRWQGIPAIAITKNGIMYCACYSGGNGEGKDNYVLVERSKDGGQTWSEPIAVVDPEGYVRAFDACLWVTPNNELALFWNQSFGGFDGRAGVFLSICKNPEKENLCWTSAIRITDGVMLNKPIIGEHGEWLLSLSLWNNVESDFNQDCTDRMIKVYATSDKGVSFYKMGEFTMPGRYYDEPMTVQHKDGTLHMLVRLPDGIGEAFSKDGGKNWGHIQKSKFWGPNSRFYFGRLMSGNLLLVNHQIEREDEESKETLFPKRSHLSAWLSEDDGLTWSKPFLLDEREGISYPDVDQDEEGNIYIIYDYLRFKEKQLLLAKITEEDILNGQIKTMGSYLRRIVDQAG